MSLNNINQMEGKISTVVGAITGTIYAATLSNLIGGMAIAIFTGAAAWLGQTIAKELYTFIKRKMSKK